MWRGTVSDGVGRVAGMSDSPLLDGLNPAQFDAVIHKGGPLLVVAGAGSGKTRVLTHRIAHLMEEGLSPFEILAITFTNKAAGEMKHRVGGLVGPVAQKMWVSTFHSACVRILRRDVERLGFPSRFSIYDQADAVRLVGYVIRDLNLDPKRFPPRSVHAAISAAKNDNIGAIAYAENVQQIYERKIADVYFEYQKRLLTAGAMDFDDLLQRTVELFRTHPDVLDSWRRRFGHVLVDEYQDTNPVQNDLVLMLAEEHRQVTVVGDSDQCLPTGTMVETPAGPRAIETLVEGDEVLGTGGGAELIARPVAHVHRSRHAGRRYRVTAGGHTIEGTPFHIVPARLDLDPAQHVVYLMYRHDRGYRIGQTKAMRSGKAGLDIGLRIRCNQEHADKAWILKVVDTPVEGSWWESWYAATYGLPTACFHGVGRSLSMSDDDLDRLYAEIDTFAGAKQLFDDLDLHDEFPHHRPQGGQNRQTLNLTMFSDVRSGDVGTHRVQWCSNRFDIADRLRAKGHSVRSGKSDSLRVETSRKHYREALDYAVHMAWDGDLEVARRAMIDGELHTFQPLSHLRPGMVVKVATADGLVDARIDTVEVIETDGDVFDLEVEDIHTYVANGVGDLWEQQAQFGYRTGIAMALHLPEGKHFLLGVDRDRPLPSDPNELQRLVADLQLFAVHAQDAAMRLLVPLALQPERPSLTPRELEVLRWTMDGKTAWEVGAVLGISERTAVLHINNAMHKLKCVNKHQAVLKALRLGLID